eukprot:CAMPEP_0203696210 /NCGR_PEP_ID=MMETSP0091-20130426/7477_1 /ASSEMBLY_ACC=CAM_ASM_001089 /TAXON_ID=426623 /ORGANISM="Chaetoceros affinis, Strain CCMP159" /LENGTH=398 /DNA_ID=CAMNT_0050567939 /DNA_START=66 /DNA_END=1262 /DNA_ORIENTATION=+
MNAQAEKKGSDHSNCGAFLKIVTFLAVLAGCSALAENNDDNDKFCVIHVGPHKTSTTTLQEFLYSQSKAGGALEKDRYKYPSFIKGYTSASKAHAILVSCVNTESPVLQPICSNEAFQSNVLEYFQSFVDNTANDRSNIILTSEEFDRPGLNITELTSFLVPHQYKINVVVYYRRFYDWIHSYYNQFNKLKEVKHPITFVEWLRDEEFFEQRLLGYSVAVYNRFKEAPGIFNVSLVNMHEDPENFNTNARFACDHMDNAPHLCAAAKSHIDGQSNPSVNLDWLIFRDKISSYHPIELLDSDERWEQIEVKFNEMTDIPRLCLSTEWKNKLLQTSLESEKALTLESWYNSEEGLENLMIDFEEKINSKLCSMDIETILLSTEWQDFLTDLQEDEVEKGS